MTRACFLLNDCAVGTLCLEEFPGKVKGMQPAHGMFCSQQEPGGSILCSVLHRLAISGVGVGENLSPQVLPEPVMFAVGPGSGRREQMSALSKKSVRSWHREGHL